MKKKIIIVLNLLLFINLLSLGLSLNDEYEYEYEYDDYDDSNDATERHGIYSSKNVDKNCTVDNYFCHLNNTECFSTICQCKSNYIEKDDICVDPIGLICYENSDCKNYELACFFGTCQSIKIFFSPENKNNSDLYSAKFIGDYCKNDEHCSSLNNTVCTMDGCECSENFFPVDNKCIERRGNITCTGHFYCRNQGEGVGCFFGTCQSVTEFFSPENKRQNALYYAKQIEDYCLNDDHCRYIPHTKCLHDRCLCSENYVRDRSNCIINSNYCQIDFDCYDNEKGCIFNTCQLLSEFFLPSNARNISLYFDFKSKHVTYCRYDYDCHHLEFTECYNYRCKCRHNYIVKDRKCRGLVNAQCYINSDCALDNTECRNGTCQLKS